MRTASILLLALGLAGCKPKADAPPSLEISTEELEFGSVGVGSDVELEVTLTNAGGGTVELLSVSLIEGQASIFDVSRDPADALGAGESAVVTVTFSPVDQRTYEGRIQIRSDDATNPNLYVTVAGEGAPSTADTDGDGYSAATGDCNDNDASSYPGAPELCDGRDNDCNDAVPRDEADADYDGWLVCEGDCNDTVATIYPGAPEICDDADSDCDGLSADRADTDGDGFSICDGDCDDAEPLAFPGNPEVCDTVDNDCSGDPDDIDMDRDGHSPCGAAGDCDDNDRTAYPVVVDAAATGEMDGTEEKPYATIEDALDNLDTVCRTIQLQPGTYEIAMSWASGRLRIGGGGNTPDEVVVNAPKGSRMFDVAGGGDLTLANLTLSGADTSGDGGAARVVGGSLTLESVVAEDNTCTGDGGAVAASTGTLTLEDCLFRRNVADDDGGAVSVLSGVFTDSGSTYEDNTGVRGGAILMESSRIDLSDLSIVGNEASDRGGGIELVGGTITALQRVDLLLNSSATIGGGLSMVDVSGATAAIRNLVVADNSAGTAGGGVAATGAVASFVFANNTVLSNEAPGEGAGVYVNATDTSGLYVWSNVIAWSAGASGLYSGDAGASVAYNLFYNTSSGTEWDIGASEDAGNNLDDDPSFRDYSNNGDPSDDDLRLGSGSPALNSGPSTGEGPEWYGEEWPDTDGTRNNRGHTGGQGAN